MQGPPTCGDHAHTFPQPQGAPATATPDHPAAPRAAGNPAGSAGAAAAAAAAAPAAAAAAASVGGPAEPHQVKCWACGVLVQVPLVGESAAPSPVFKCGWCGAITEYMRSVPSPRAQTVFRFIMRTLAGFKWGIVLFVTLLTLSIILPGAVVVLPQTCGSGTLLFFISHALTWLLSFNVLYNFAAAVTTTPGTVKDCFAMPVKMGEPIPQGCFDGFRYCYSCKYFKPPPAHHCNICNTCVIDLDHHCPFINNCVGPANMRNFIAFMLWTVLAMLFCCAHTAALLFHLRLRPFVEAMTAAWLMRRNAWDIFLVTLFVILSTPWDLLIPLYIFSASTGVLVGVGMLLSSQLRHIYLEAIALHLQHLQHLHAVDPAAAAAAAAACSSSKLRHRAALFCSRWQAIMGSPGVGQWLWPMWGPPEGTFGSVAKKQL